MNNNANTQVAFDNEVTVIGFNRRLVAAIYDGFLVAFLSFILVFALGFLAIFIGMYRELNDQRMQVIMVLSAFIASFLYFVIAWGGSGQTIGKAISGIKVVRADGNKLGYGKAVVRYVGYVVSGLLLSLGFLWIGFDPRRQGWHDKIAGTLVTLADDDFANEKVSYKTSDTGGSKWVWVGVWFLVALVAPYALVGVALMTLGPVLRRAIESLGG